MEQALSWYDKYTVQKDRVMLTQEQLHIPGLRMLGHHTSYNATSSLSWHYHKSAFEFSLPVQGTFSFATREESFPFSGGQVFVSFPDEVHGTDQRPITVGELYWFQLDISKEQDLLFLSPKASKALVEQLLTIPRHVVNTDIKKTLPLLEKAFSLAFRGENPYLTATLIQLFLHLTLEYSREESSSVSEDINTVLEYIRENLTEELPLELLASVAGLSCSQFKQKFKKQLGVSPRHYINQQKIEYSKVLLESGKSVTETAMLLSFSDSSYFSTVFKKYTLFTPLQYLRYNKEKEVRPCKTKSQSH